MVIGNCLVLWVSKLQTEVAAFTMEAEYITLSMAMRGVIPLRSLVDEVKELLGRTSVPCPSKVFEDNNRALVLATTPQMTPRVKHIDVKSHFFKEHIQNGNIQVLKVASEDQIADCMTKSSDKIKFE